MTIDEAHAEVQAADNAAEAAKLRMQAADAAMDDAATPETETEWDAAMRALHEAEDHAGVAWDDYMDLFEAGSR
jgi:hypothetical protein